MPSICGSIYLPFDRLAGVQAILPHGRSFAQLEDAADDLARSIAVLNDVSERLPHLPQSRRLSSERAQLRLGIADRRLDRVFYFLGDVKQTPDRRLVSLDLDWD